MKPVTIPLLKGRFGEAIPAGFQTGQRVTGLIPFKDEEAKGRLLPHVASKFGAVRGR